MIASLRQMAATFAASGLIALAAAGRGDAGTIVVSLDGLPTNPVVPDGHGGIAREGHRITSTPAGFPTHSAPIDVTNNGHAINTDFALIIPEVFLGAVFSGNASAPITFRLYLRGALAATSAAGAADSTPTSFASGYCGFVDDLVVVSSDPGDEATGDATYQAAPAPVAVPGPSSGTLSGIAVAIGLAHVCRRRFKPAAA